MFNSKYQKYKKKYLLLKKKYMQYGRGDTEIEKYIKFYLRISPPIFEDNAKLTDIYDKLRLKGGCDPLSFLKNQLNMREQRLNEIFSYCRLLNESYLYEGKIIIKTNIDFMQNIVKPTNSWEKQLQFDMDRYRFSDSFIKKLRKSNILINTKDLVNEDLKLTNLGYNVIKNKQLIDEICEKYYSNTFIMSCLVQNTTTILMNLLNDYIRPIVHCVWVDETNMECTSKKSSQYKCEMCVDPNIIFIENPTIIIDDIDNDNVVFYTYTQKVVMIKNVLIGGEPSTDISYFNADIIRRFSFKKTDVNTLIITIDNIKIDL